MNDQFTSDQHLCPQHLLDCADTIKINGGCILCWAFEERKKKYRHQSRHLIRYLFRVWITNFWHICWAFALERFHCG